MKGNMYIEDRVNRIRAREILNRLSYNYKFTPFEKAYYQLVYSILIGK